MRVQEHITNNLFFTEHGARAPREQLLQILEHIRQCCRPNLLLPKREFDGEIVDLVVDNPARRTSGHARQEEISGRRASGQEKKEEEKEKKVHVHTRASEVDALSTCT